jgi:hypothetical protein
MPPFFFQGLTLVLMQKNTGASLILLDFHELLFK